jgi:hypothetical protein
MAMGRGTTIMSQALRGLYGVVAVALMLGALPVAAGRDVPGGTQLLLGAPPSGINREAKADRFPRVMRPDAATQTISLQVSGLADTSVVIRMPAAAASRKGSSAPSSIRSGSGKPTVACEPVVSVLTEVAKLLQPGRCVT